MVLPWVGLSLGACAHKTDTGEVTPRPVASIEVPPPPPAPAGGIGMPTLNAPWMPPTLTAGSADELGRVLRGHKGLAVTLGPKVSSTAWEKRANDLIHELHPTATVVGRESAFLKQVMIERGKFPIFQQVVPSGGVDLFGRPTYVVQNVTLDTEWVGQQKLLKAADGFVGIDEVGFDLRTWRDVRVSLVGGCEAPAQELALARGNGEDLMTPFLAWSERALFAEFKTRLGPALDQLDAKLAPYRGERPEDSDHRTWACGTAALAMTASWSNCGDDPALCPMAPRVVMGDAMVVGIAEPGAYLGADCADRLGIDVQGTLHAVASEAAQAAVKQFDPRWLELGTRVASLGAIEQTLAQACKPRRRRFWEADVAEMQRQLAVIGSTLQAPGAVGGGAWRPSVLYTRSAGRGAVKELLRFDPGDANPGKAAVRQAEALGKFVRSHERCTQIYSWLPFVVTVADVATGELEFFGYFYDEELFCQGMPPLLSEPVPTESAPAPATPSAGARSKSK